MVGIEPSEPSSRMITSVWGACFFPMRSSGERTDEAWKCGLCCKSMHTDVTMQEVWCCGHDRLFELIRHTNVTNDCISVSTYIFEYMSRPLHKYQMSRWEVSLCAYSLIYHLLCQGRFYLYKRVQKSNPLPTAKKTRSHRQSCVHVCICAYVHIFQPLSPIVAS